jgi:hypothetical protein
VGTKTLEDYPIKRYGRCAYPSCTRKNIDQNEPFVAWNGVGISEDQVMGVLSPIGRLAESANRPDVVVKTGVYWFNMEMHTECAAEWGMHLIKDALDVSYNLGSKLRESKK